MFEHSDRNNAVEGFSLFEIPVILKAKLKAALFCWAETGNSQEIQFVRLQIVGFREINLLFWNRDRQHMHP